MCASVQQTTKRASASFCISRVGRHPSLTPCVFVLIEPAEHPDIVEDAIKFIIFLSDVDRLYDVALGMYNFQLVLMIAQYSQKVRHTLFAMPFRFSDGSRIQRNICLSCENCVRWIGTSSDSASTIILVGGRAR
jgi:hypothetical protein